MILLLTKPQRISSYFKVDYERILQLKQGSRKIHTLYRRSLTPFIAVGLQVVPDELADMAQRYEEFRERNGYNNEGGGRGGRGGGMDVFVLLSACVLILLSGLSYFVRRGREGRETSKITQHGGDDALLFVNI